MLKVIAIMGFGAGVSAAVAERFGSQGFAVAAVARNPQRLGEGVARLRAQGVTAAAFPSDVSDPAAIQEVLAGVRKAVGPVTVLHWNAYGNEAGDLLTADAAHLRQTLDLATVGLVAAVQAALPDLKAAKEGAVLITNGAFGDLDPQVDAAAVAYKSMGLALANAAKHKLAGLLAARLQPEGVYVGEATITGTIKGSIWADANAMDAAVVASAFWKLYQARKQTYVRV